MPQTNTEMQEIGVVPQGMTPISSTFSDISLISDESIPLA